MFGPSQVPFIRLPDSVFADGFGLKKITSSECTTESHSEPASSDCSDSEVFSRFSYSFTWAFAEEL